MIVNTPKNTVKMDSQGLDYTLRPKSWQEYVGQAKIKKTLEVMIAAARQRKEPLDHLLFYGNPGLGKTTLSNIIAKEMNVNILTTSGPNLRHGGDMASILTNLNPGDILFIDEIHRMNKVCEEIIYPVMEDYTLHLVVGKGPTAQTMQIALPPFTLIGATTKMAMLSPPLRSRFGAILQLNPYTHSEMQEIITKSAKALNVCIDQQAIDSIAKCSRSTPRIANHILKRVRDFAQVHNANNIDYKITTTALECLEIDNMGLATEDRKILNTLIKNFDGGPIGIKTLSAATKEEEESILDIYEPYLIQIGFLERTPKGRKATKMAYQYLGLEYREPKGPTLL